MISSPEEAVEASRCALDRMAKSTETGCERSSAGCRWCAHPVKPLLQEIRSYLDNPKNLPDIARYQMGNLI